jgi:hypothetical protein
VGVRRRRERSDRRDSWSSGRTLAPVAVGTVTVDHPVDELTSLVSVVEGLADQPRSAASANSHTLAWRYPAPVLSGGDDGTRTHDFLLAKQI